jgi:hypothetical protein
MSAVSSKNSGLQSFFVQNKDKAVCLICKNSVSVSKSAKLSGITMRVIKKNMTYSKLRSEPINLRVCKELFRPAECIQVSGKWEFNCRAS